MLIDDSGLQTRLAAGGDWPLRHGASYFEGAGRRADKELTVFIIDPHPLIRLGIKSALIGLRWSLRSIEAEELDALPAIEVGDEGKYNPDLIVLGATLMERQALDLLGELHLKYPSAPIVLFCPGACLHLAKEAYRQGVSGFILESMGIRQIPLVLSFIIEGGIFVPYQLIENESSSSSSSSSSCLVYSPEKNVEVGGELNSVTEPLRKLYGNFTVRQVQVIRLMLRGLSNKEISRELRISSGTVKNHIAVILQRLGVTSRAKAIGILFSLRQCALSVGRRTALFLMLTLGTCSWVSGADGSVRDIGVQVPLKGWSEPRHSEGRWSLDRLLDVAIATSPVVLSKRSELDGANISEEVARWQYYPTPSVSVLSLEGQTATTFSLKQPLWTGGRLEADLGVATARVGVAEKSITEARLDVAVRMVNAWGTVVGAHGRRLVQESEVRRLRELSSMMGRRYKAEFSSKTEMDLASARLTIAESDLALAVAEERSAFEALLQSLGRTIALDDLEPLDQAAQRVQRSIPLDAVDRVLSTHPTLRRLEAEIEVASRQVDQAGKSVWPTLYARLDVQRGSMPGTLGQGTRFYVGVDQSFGAGLAAFAQADVAKAQLEAIRMRLEAARRDIQSTVAADIEGYRAAVDYERGVQSNLQAQSMVADSYQRMFLAGKRSWLDLLNMVREQSEAERQFVTARTRRVMLAYRLALDFGEYPWMQ